MTAEISDWPMALRLLCGCLGSELSEHTRALAKRMTQADWHVFVHLACTRHRVAPVVAPHLPSLEAPPVATESIRQDARASTLGALRQTAALKDLLAELGAIGVEPVVLKGMPLAERLYGGAGNRHARDIDILVPPGKIHPAAQVLNHLGYVPAPHYRLRGTLVGTRALAQECYDLEYFGGRGRLTVELHWRTSHYAGWPDFTEDADMTQVQETAIGPIRVPSDSANLVYLAGHGSMHAWARLKWLADLGRFATLRGEEALAEDMTLAAHVGGQPPLELGLRVAHRVMGSPLPMGLAPASPRMSRLEDQMLRVISVPENAPGTWRYRLSANVLSLQLAQGPAQVAGVLRYAVWRRLRLGVAGLWHALGRQPAL